MFKIQPHVVWRKKKELLVLLDTKSGSYFTLNSTGQDLWQKHIVEGQSLDVVAKEISSHYANPPDEEQIVGDCCKLIEQWLSNNLIIKAELSS